MLPNLVYESYKSVNS